MNIDIKKKAHAMSTGNSKGVRRRKPQPMALEPRFMFDGAAVATAVEGTHTDIFAIDPAIDPAHDATAAIDAAALHVPAAIATETAARHEIVFIDPSIANWQTLAADARAGVEVVVLDPARDAFDQMAGRLANRSGIDAIHLLSHGAQGQLIIGGTAYQAQSLDQHADALAAIGRALTERGDILLYGCDVGSGSSGDALISAIARATQADVAASSDTTGASTPWGGNWVLEKQTGSIETGLFAPLATLQQFDGKLATVSLTGNTGWTAIMFGTGQDPHGDSQAGAADTDIIGDATHGSLYTAYDDNGTVSTADDTLVFRMRIDNPTSTTNFAGVAIVGMDANLDGRVDIFMSVDGRNNGQQVRLLDPGTGANISPSTTSTSALPTGWLLNNGIYSFSASNYAVTAVSATSDPHWNGDTDLSNDGKADVFISWRVPIADLTAVLAKASPVDRNGIYGPRGATGIAGYNKDTVVQYVSFTQTQTGPINGDLNGVGASYDKNASFASLGTFTAPMSASNPVGVSTSLSITDNVAGVANNAVTFTFQFSEGVTGFDASDVNISGGTKGAFTAIDSATYTLVVTPDAGIDSGSIDVSVAAGAAQSASGLPTASASAAQAYDTLAPSISIDTPALALSGKPTITGTSDLADGSLVMVTVDPDNNPATGNLVYQVMVTGGAWTLNTAAVAPVSGSMPAGGLTSYTKVSATATDAAGNSSTAVELNRPTVNAVSTNNTRPVVSGTWTHIAGDVLTVTVNGATYTLAPSGNNWSLDLSSASPTSGSLGALSAGNSYDVSAIVTRSGVGVSDTTTGELTITSTPVVAIDITGGATAAGSSIRPVITGTSSNAGGFVIVRLDPNNDGDLSDAVTYSVTPAGDGSWSLDTASAMPISGVVPAGGFAGTNGIVASDSTGAVSDSQVLSVSTPTVAIGSIVSTATGDAYGQISNSGGGAAYLNMTEDNSVSISGTATGASSVDLVIRDINGHVAVVSGVAVSGGSWSASGLDLSSLDNGVLTVSATISGTTISATNTSVTHDKTAPRIFITNPSEIKKNGGVIYGGSELANTSLTVTVRDSSDTTTAWTGTVITNANGDWTVTTSGNLVSGSTGNVIIKVAPTATAADSAGNIVQQASKSQYVAANAATTTISINTIAGDDLITSGEIAGGVVISGTTTLTGTPTISIAVTDSTSTTVPLSTTASSGTWSVVLSNAQIKTLANGSLTVTATASDGSITISDVALPSLSLPSPTLTISDDVPGTASGSFTYTFTFSEAVIGFDATDIVVTGGSKGTFTAVNASTYTLQVTPDASSSGEVQVSVADGKANSVSTGRANVGAAASQSFNTTGAAAAPTITIDIDALATDGTPIVSGTTSLSPGAPIVLTIDTDNDGDADLSYSAIVQSGGTWSVDIGSATPVSGSLPADGLPSFARITATATNAYGNSTSVQGQNTPTVNYQVTNDNTPTVSGTWTNISGDSLSVAVNGVTYSVANGNLTVDATTWSLTTGTLADDTYDVTATVTRGGSSKVDASSAELAVDTAASVDITGPASVVTNDATPLISGTAGDVPVGTILTLSIDTDSNGSYDLVYQTAIDVAGNWTIDTATAVPVSGRFPASGLNGATAIRASATDAAGNTGTDAQILVVDVSPPAIALNFNAKTADTTPLITGTTDLPENSTITVEIDPNNDGDWSDRQVYNATVQADGAWSVEATTALSGTVGVRASGTDAAGNVTTTGVKPLEIVASAPAIVISDPISGVGLDHISDASEDDAVVLAGSTSNVAAGSSITVTISDGNITITDTAQVQSDGSWNLAALNLSAMANGPISVSAEVFDSDGSVYRSTATFTHDKSAVVAIDAISDDTGTPGDFITRDNSIVVTGSAAPGSSVTVLVKDAAAAVVANFSVTSDAGGTWSTSSTAALAPGNYTIEASIDGNVATHSLVIVDGTAPTLLTSMPADNATGVAPGTDLSLTFSKDIHAGSGFISLYKADGTLVENFDVATGKGDAGGTIRFNGAAGVVIDPASDLEVNGSYYLNIGDTAVLDNGGNAFAGISDASTLSFTTSAGADDTAPAAPAISLLPDSDSGTSNSDARTNDDTPTLRVSLNGSDTTAPVAGDVVKLYEGSTLTGSAVLSDTDIGTGYVDITTSALGSEGIKSITATVTDAAGNASLPSSALALLLDRTAPSLESATADGSSLVLTYTEAGVGLDVATPAAGDFSVKSNGADIAVDSVSVDAGAKTVTLTLASDVFNGDTVSVSYIPGTSRLADIAGNDAAGFDAQAVSNNTAAVTPTQSVTISRITDDVGNVTGTVAEGGVTDDVNPLLSGSLSAGLHAGEVVKVYRNGVAIGNASVSGTDWSYTDDGLADGDHVSYTARVENGGLTGTLSDTYGITIDTAAATPTVVLLSDTGSSGSDRITRDGALNLSGIEDGASVQYSTDGTSWSTTAPTANEGSNTVYVRQIDVAGNTSAASSLSYTLDTVAPVVVSATVDGSTLVLSYADVNNLDAVQIAGSNCFAVTVDGVAVAVSNVAVAAGSKTVTLTLAAPVLAGQAVTVGYSDPSAADDGSATQDVAGNDAAGFDAQAVSNNTAAVTPTQSVTISRITDDVGNVTGTVAEGGVTDDVNPLLSGSLSAGLHAGEVVKVYRNGVAIGNASVSGTDWSYTDDGLADGDHVSYTARVENGGLTGTLSDTYGITIDTAAATPTLVLLSDTGSSGNDRITRDGALNLSGIEDGASVQYSTDGTSWSTTAPTAHEGSNTVYVRQIDVAGNTSAASSLSYTLDTTVATPAVALASDTGSSASDRITRDGALNLSGIEDGASVQYSTDGTSWSTTAPTAHEGSNTVYVRQIDVAGNTSAASRLSYTLDTVAPVVVSAFVDGSTLVLRYKETGSGMAAFVPDAGSFSVTRNGAPVIVTGTALEPSTHTVTLTLGEPVKAAETITISYAGGKLRDLAGNPAAAFAALGSSNLTAAAVPPPVPTTPVEVVVAPPATSRALETPIGSAEPEAPSQAAAGSLLASNPAANDPLAPFGAASMAALDPMVLRNERTPAPMPSDLASGLRTGSSNFDNVLTSPGQNAFRITVAKASEPNLMRFRGIPDQDFVSDAAITVQVPVDAFVHTDAKAVVKLNARMANGEPLPPWLKFDSTTGKFSGEAPAGFADELVLVVEARDADGRHADAMFRIKLAPKRPDGHALNGRPGLSEQFKAARRGGLDRLQAAAPAKKAA